MATVTDNSTNPSKQTSVSGEGSSIIIGKDITDTEELDSPTIDKSIASITLSETVNETTPNPEVL